MHLNVNKQTSLLLQLNTDIYNGKYRKNEVSSQSGPLLLNDCQDHHTMKDSHVKLNSSKQSEIDMLHPISL